MRNEDQPECTGCPSDCSKCEVDLFDIQDPSTKSHTLSFLFNGLIGLIGLAAAVILLLLAAQCFQWVCAALGV